MQAIVNTCFIIRELRGPNQKYIIFYVPIWNTNLMKITLMGARILAGWQKALHVSTKEQKKEKVLKI